MKSHSRKWLMREADRVFSLWIRGRDGWACVQCGSTKQVTCGHLISRRIMNLRFSEMNCNAQCWGCNSGHRYWPHKYTAWYVGKFGQNSYLNLEEESRKVKQWKSHELEAIIAKYR